MKKTQLQVQGGGVVANSNCSMAHRRRRLSDAATPWLVSTIVQKGVGRVCRERFHEMRGCYLGGFRQRDDGGRRRCGGHGFWQFCAVRDGHGFSQFCAVRGGHGFVFMNAGLFL